jgi:hypothetical protein
MYRHIAIIIASAVTAITAAAQNPLDSIQQLDEVTITASTYSEVIPSQRLSGKQLETLSSYSVADAVRYFSGVQIKDYGGVGGLKTVDIRSMGTNHLGVFYDGIQLGNAQNGQIDLGKFSLDNIEEISLYNGQKSEIFQSAKDFGSAGTIYLRSRRPKFADGKRTNIVSRFRTGSFGLVNPSVLLERRLGGKDGIRPVSASVSAEYVAATGKYPFRYRRVMSDKTVAWDTTAVRQNGDIHSFRLENGLYGYTESGRWQAKTYFYDSEKGIPGAIVDNVWKRSQRQWDRNFFAQGEYSEALFNTSFQAKMKYAGDYMHYFSPDTAQMHIDNSFMQHEVYVSVADMYSLLKNWNINLSLDYQYNTLTSDLKNFVFPIRNTLLAALATAFEWQRFKAQASILGTFVFEDVRNEKAARPANKKEYTPAVFVSYQPFACRCLNFRAFYKRIFRMPTFNDLYYTDIGNIRLKPEYTTQYNVGFQYDAPQTGRATTLHLRADGYYIEVEDKIVAIPKGNGQYRWMMMNLGFVEIRGIDISASMKTKAGTDCTANLQLNYTFQRAQEFSAGNDDRFRGGQIAYIPWHSGSAIANFEWRRWDFNYSFIYVGERYHNSANISENYERPWYTHDLTAGKTIRFRKGAPFSATEMKLSAEVNNVLNQYYDVVLNYPMPGRNFKIILKITI